jgi:hypothetical protein
VFSHARDRSGIAAWRWNPQTKALFPPAMMTTNASRLASKVVTVATVFIERKPTSLKILLSLFL